MSQKAESEQVRKWESEIGSAHFLPFPLSCLSLRPSVLALRWSLSVSRFRYLDRQIQPISPLFPRADVVADFLITQKPQRQIAVGRAVSALSVGHDALLRRNPCGFIEFTKFCGRSEHAVLV